MERASCGWHVVLWRAAFAAGTLVPSILASFDARAALSPIDRYTEEYSDCVRTGNETVRAGGRSWECSICDVAVSCSFAPSGWTCDSAAGARTSSMTPAQVEADTRTFIKMYCTGSGGVMVQTASAAGVQARLLGAAFDSITRGNKRTASRGAGGVYEISAMTIEDLGGTSLSHGVAIPFSFPLKSGPSSGGDMRGNGIFGYDTGVAQYGANIAPNWTWTTLGDEVPTAGRAVLGLTLPLQLLGASGGELDYGVSYLAGLGVLAGVARTSGRGTVGVGTSVQAQYGGGIQAPATVAFRASFDASALTRLVFQPSVSAEIEALGGIVDTIRPSVILGLEIGNAVVGLQGFFQQDVYTGGLGVSYIDTVGQAAAGTYKPDYIGPSPESGSQQPPPAPLPGQPVYAPEPQPPPYADGGQTAAGVFRAGDAPPPPPDVFGQPPSSAQHYPSQPTPAAPAYAQPAAAQAQPQIYAAPVAPVVVPPRETTVSCTDAASCVSAQDGFSAESDCPETLTTVFQNACGIRFVCRACPAVGSTIFGHACQTVVVPPQNKAPAAVSFCGARNVRWKCAAERESETCLSF